MRAVLFVALLLVPGAHATRVGGSVVALVTAESENQLIAVDLPTGRILRRLPMPTDPENVEANLRVAVVVSARGGAVTLVSLPKLRVRKVIRGFGAPHIPALSPDGRWAYVTDDARGELAVLDLARGQVVQKLFVGYGAHHISVRPDGRLLWIALGEQAHALAVVETSNPRRPRLAGTVDPQGAAHDLAFSPDGRRVWITYDDRPRIAVFDAAKRRRSAILSADAAPQHVAFGQGIYARYAYVTSGRAGTLRVVSRSTGRAVKVVHVPEGSFNFGLIGGVVATSSLTRGILTELDAAGARRLLTKRIAPATRDVALALLP